jgi:hypothetical protein
MLEILSPRASKSGLDDEGAKRAAHALLGPVDAFYRSLVHTPLRTERFLSEVGL